MPRGNPQNLLRGGPGRPKGVPNKATAEIKAVARRLVEDPLYVTALAQRLVRGRAPHMETLLFHYAYGKPKETVEHSGTLEMPARVVIELHKTTRDAA